MSTNGLSHVLGLAEKYSGAPYALFVINTDESGLTFREPESTMRPETSGGTPVNESTERLKPRPRTPMSNSSRMWEGFPTNEQLSTPPRAMSISS
jgi:hypothetical protein